MANIKSFKVYKIIIQTTNFMIVNINQTYYMLVANQPRRAAATEGTAGWPPSPVSSDLQK